MQLEEIRELRVAVKPEELRELGTKLAREVQDLADTEARHATAKKSMKEDEEARTMSINRLSRVVATGIDYRPVKCAREYDFARGVVTIVRLDTGEVAATREITDHERQESLPEVVPSGSSTEVQDAPPADPKPKKRRKE